MPLPEKIKITERSDLKKELRSEELSRFQLFLYVFEDFFRGMYLIGCMIMDFLIIFPFIPGTSYAYFVLPYYQGFYDGFPIYLVYSVLIVALLEPIFLMLEVKGWIRLFGRDATERRYRART
jgi:hypothetical protein